MSKIISIITPILNNEKTIEKVILSIKNQDYPFIEHIIIDGGSTDGTISIIQKYSEQYSLKWISEKDEGVADAMNKGFNMATGEIFTWIDADNYYINKNFISEVMKIHNSQETDVVLTNCYHKHDGSDKLFLINSLIPNYDILVNKGNKLTPECVFFKNYLFKKAGGFNLDYKLLADYEFWIKIFSNNLKVVKIPIVSIIYVASEDSLLRRKPFLSWKESFVIGEVYKRKLISKIIFKIKYLLFNFKYPFLKFIKKHEKLRIFLIKIFR